METDPVCGMSVERGEALQSEYMGAVFYFCSAVCKGAFDQDPERFAGVAAKERAAGN